MSQPEPATVATLLQQKLLDQLQSRARTWDDLRGLTKINAEALGFIILELLNQRKIWTIQNGDVRVYGIERRIGLTPRFAREQRRATDHHVSL
jgi:hypothetical protein